MVADDIAAFDGLMAAYRLPKSNEEEKSRRAEAIQSNLRAATETPLACARACAAVVALSRRAAEKGFAGVVSDAGVGVLAANSALRSAALNVYINAPTLKDRAFAAGRDGRDRTAAGSLRARERGGVRIGARQAGIATVDSRRITRFRLCLNEPRRQDTPRMNRLTANSPSAKSPDWLIFAI